MAFGLINAMKPHTFDMQNGYRLIVTRERQAPPQVMMIGILGGVVNERTTYLHFSASLGDRKASIGEGLGNDDVSFKEFCSRAAKCITLLMQFPTQLTSRPDLLTQNERSPHWFLPCETEQAGVLDY